MSPALLICSLNSLQFVICFVITRWKAIPDTVTPAIREERITTLHVYMIVGEHRPKLHSSFCCQLVLQTPLLCLHLFQHHCLPGFSLSFNSCTSNYLSRCTGFIFSHWISFYLLLLLFLLCFSLNLTYLGYFRLTAMVSECQISFL